MASASPAIANEFIALAEKQNRRLTQMQLQKLAYIAHGWNLVINGEPLVSDPVEAWDYGPVFPDLYDHARYFGSAPINRLITPSDSDRHAFFLRGDDEPRSQPYKANLIEREKRVIEQVWDRYGNYSAFKLSDLTHKPGTPWFKTYFHLGKNSQISNDVIQEHYLELAERAATP